MYVTEDASALGRRELLGHFASRDVEMLDSFPKLRVLVKCDQALPGKGLERLLVLGSFRQSLDQLPRNRTRSYGFNP